MEKCKIRDSCIVKVKTRTILAEGWECTA